MLTNILMSIVKVVMSIFKVVTQNISSVTYIYIYILSMFTLSSFAMSISL